MFPWKNILVATDFSECSRRALRDAVALASQFGGHVTLVHVTPTPAGLMLSDATILVRGADAGRQAMQMADYLEQKTKALLAADLAALAADAALADALTSVTVTTRALFGEPVKEVTRLAAALGADLLVVGTHGRSGWRHMVLGSVAERLIQASTIPVLTSKSAVPCVEDPRGLDTPELTLAAEQTG